MKFKIINYRVALVLILISSITSPYISSFYKSYLGLFVFTILGFILILLGKNRKLYTHVILSSLNRNKLMFICLLWFVAGIMFSFFRGANNYGYLLATILLPIYYLLGNVISSNEKYKSFFIRSVFFFLTLNLILVGQTIGYDSTARDVLINSSEEGLLVGNTKFWGVIGIFFPLFFAEIFKENKLVSKSLLIICSVFIIYKLFFSGFATPVALLLLNFLMIGVFYFLLNTNKIKDLYKSILISGFFIIISYYVFNWIISSQVNALSDISYRFNNFINNPLSGGYNVNSEAVSRFALMSYSWDTFTSYPLFGSGGNIQTSIYEGNVGGHSSLFDAMGALGLLGGSLGLIIFLYKALKNAYLKMKEKSSLYNISQFSSVVTFIIGGIMNPYWSGAIFIIFLLSIKIRR